MASSKPTSHQVSSQSLHSTWLEDPAATSAVTSALTSSPPRSNVPKSASSPSSSPTPAITDNSQNHRYNALPTPSSGLPQFSAALPVSLPPTPRDNPPLSQPLVSEKHTSSQYQVNTGHHLPYGKSEAFPHHRQPVLSQPQDSSMTRFTSLLNVTSRASSSQMAPVLSVQPQGSSANVSSFGFLRLPREPSTSSGLNMSRKSPASQQNQGEPNHIRSTQPPLQPISGKIFDSIDQLAKYESCSGQSQTPTCIQQYPSDMNLASFNKQESQTRSQQGYDSRQPYSNQQQTNASLFPPFQQQHYTGISQAQLQGEDPPVVREEKYDGCGAFSKPHQNHLRGSQGEGPTAFSGIRPLPSPRTFGLATDLRAGANNVHFDGLNRMDNSSGLTPRGRVMPLSSLKGGHGSSGVHPTGWNGSLLKDAMKTFQGPGTTINTERNAFLNTYTDLMTAYEEKCDAIFDAADSTCINLIVNARIPFLVDTMTAPVDDETAEDAQQKLIVKRKFVDAMQRLQEDQLPTKRRGNLPKESTSYLRRWFDAHYDHPYPSDEEKLAMSKITKIGIQQISHWFINYRKRVWKPSLPPNHPVHLGEGSRRPRKKMRTN